jgi:hypothetical protein
MILSDPMMRSYLTAIAPYLAAVTRTRLADRAPLRHLASLRALVGR